MGPEATARGKAPTGNITRRPVGMEATGTV